MPDLRRVYPCTPPPPFPRRKYWVDPDPLMVPGFHAKAVAHRPPPRHDATPDLRDKVGDPALRPH